MKEYIKLTYYLSADSTIERAEEKGEIKVSFDITLPELLEIIRKFLIMAGFSGLEGKEIVIEAQGEANDEA